MSSHQDIFHISVPNEPPISVFHGLAQEGRPPDKGAWVTEQSALTGPKLGKVLGCWQSEEMF